MSHVYSRVDSTNDQISNQMRYKILNHFLRLLFLCSAVVQWSVADIQLVVHGNMFYASTKKGEKV